MAVVQFKVDLSYLGEARGDDLSQFSDHSVDLLIYTHQNDIQGADHASPPTTG